jgi:tetratricopeptide (TPR) repeat protein
MAPDPFGDLEGQSFDLPAFTFEESEDGLATDLRDLLAARRFQEVLNRARQEQAAVAGSSELQQIVNLAHERMEAEPFLNKFLSSARQAANAGDAAEAARMLEKARALDASHPDIARLSATIPAPLTAPSFGAPAPVAGRSLGDRETDERIRTLIAEGQAALDAGDPQGAIDAGSRIFLIDIDHQEAARLIESARRLKAERERQVEEIFHQGLAHLDAGDSAQARQAFQKVLAIQPSYLAAREYLDQIDAGKVPSARAQRSAPSLAPVLPLPSDQDLVGDDLKQEILVPPEPIERGGKGRTGSVSRAARPSTVTAAKEKRGGRLFYLVGGGVLVILLAGGGYVLLNRDQLFPNSRPSDQPTPSPSTVDPIARAEALHTSGKTPIAIAQLRRIPESDPSYARAQELISEWEAEVGQEPTTNLAAEPGTELPPHLQARREGLLASARAAFAERSYFRALSRLREADEILRLGGEDAQMREVAESQLARLSSQLNLFYEHEWQFALPDLWRLHEANPTDREITHLIVDCYYNLAVRDLQRADTKKAIENLKEAAKLEPGDPILARHIAFAETYTTRDKDLLYRIYVKYLPTR